MNSGSRSDAVMILMGLISLMIVSGTVHSWPTGGEMGGDGWTDEVVVQEKGCYCHTNEPSDLVTVTVLGFPVEYEPDVVYNLSMSVDDGREFNEGGFLANINEGEFRAEQENYWISDDHKYVSHSNRFDREWEVQWTAPSEGTGDAILIVYFNAVNNDTGSEAGGSGGDYWNSITLRSMGTPQAEETSIADMGVSLKQYWIGLTGIGVVLFTVLLAYIIIRGGSANYRG